MICEIVDCSPVFRNQLVCGKFRIIVNGNSLDVFLVGLKQPSDFLNQRF